MTRPRAQAMESEPPGELPEVGGATRRLSSREASASPSLRAEAKNAPSPIAAKSPIEFAGKPVKRAMLAYLRMLVGLIERRLVGLEEIVSMLARIVRQRRIARQSRVEYILSKLNRGPP